MTFRVNPDCLYQSRRLPLPNGNRCPCNIYHPHSERKLMPISSNRRKVLALGLLMGLLCANRLGAQNKPVEADPARIKRLQPYLQTPTLIGQGKYTYWGFDVYNASLWAGESTIASDQWASQRIALDLQYLRDFTGLKHWRGFFLMWAKANISLASLFPTQVRNFYMTTPLLAKSKTPNWPNAFLISG